MSRAKHLQAYQKTGVLTARPEDLQLMLYDGALRFCEQGRLALTANDRETACHCLERARRIVLYLSETLQPERAPELCALVGSAYLFVYQRLVDAALHGGTDVLQEAIGVLHELRGAWAELLVQARAPQAGQPEDQPAQEPTSDAASRTPEGGVRLTG